MSEGVLVVDVNGQVQMANVAACEMLQIVKSPLRRHYLELIRHPKLIKQITGALKEGGSSRSETILNTDPPRICFASVTHFVSQDEPGIVLVLHDVTNYRRSMQIRQDFVANVSHELRTPLTAIRGSVDTLLDQDNVADERRFLEIIARHTARMESLVRDLLRLARLDAGQEALDLIPCSIASLFAEVQTELDSLITSKTQRIDIRITPNPLIITADHAKLHDVIKNLIENAAQYSERDTTIEVTATTDDNEGVIVVGDRGPGIPDRDLVRVFERFYRVEQSRTREPGGTGLGLAIVKHLVGLHGGSVLAANRSGGGSLFTVRLPKARSVVADSDGFS
jgi:two-component system phosphate regulon sensor histidine kinase PhoR